MHDERMNKELEAHQLAADAAQQATHRQHEKLQQQKELTAAETRRRAELEAQLTETRSELEQSQQQLEETTASLQGWVALFLAHVRIADAESEKRALQGSLDEKMLGANLLDLRATKLTEELNRAKEQIEEVRLFSVSMLTCPPQANRLNTEFGTQLEVCKLFWSSLLISCLGITCQVARS